MVTDDASMDDWKAAFAEVDRLYDLDDAALAAELDALRAVQPDLHARVVKLLDGRAEADIGPLTRELGKAVMTAAPGARAGQEFGAWRLERPLGEGGMGEVWLARRSDGRMQGELALKLLHLHLARPDVRRRFQREGQIASRLSHPNIARLHDAGAAADGTLYLVFEYVEGQRIDEWCDARQLDLAARIRLFLDVCAAVAHAHLHLIVHRDLKPSNILVTADGCAKLLDFGIAKLLETEADAPAQTELTRLGGRAMTPAYAAPEQVLGESVTTLTDVYALGVLLYVLLTGIRPYGSLQSTAAELERCILDVDPRPLPAAAGVDGSAAAEVGAVERAARRGTTPVRLRKALAGDLENIVRKALRKRPADRYPSVVALADELRRYLNHEPVQARPDAFGYRAAKFVRRHRTGSLAAALVAAAAAAGVAGVLWQAERARAQALRAERVKDFVVSVFQQQDPLARAGTDSISPAPLIGAAIGRADEELRADPALHAELLGDLGEIQFNLGDVKGSTDTLQRALHEQEGVKGADSLEVAEALRRLTMPLLQNDYAQALRDAERALAILRSHGQGDTVEAARVELRLAASISASEGASERCLALHADANRILQAKLGPNNPETIRALFEQAASDNQSRRDVEAEALLRDVIARYERLYGPNSVQLAAPLEMLARVLGRNNRASQAVPILQRAIALTLASFGPHHNRLATLYSTLGTIEMIELGHFADAEKAFQQERDALPPGADLDLAVVLKDLGRLHCIMQRPQQAEGELRQSFDLFRAHAGENTALTWYVASQWGVALMDLGRYTEAEAIQRQAAQRLREIMGASAYNNVLTAEVLADTLDREGPGNGPRLTEIVQLRRLVVDFTDKTYPVHNGLWARRAAELARALIALDGDAGRKEARTLLDAAIACYRKQTDPTDRVGEALLTRSHLEARTGERTAALADLREAIPLIQHQLLANPPALKDAQTLLRGLERG
jgi:serine/threonine-protein kinase